MKTLKAFLILTSLLFCLYACKKDGNTPGSVAGRWNIVSDSTYVGVGFNNHEVTYTGQSGDYYEFMTNGILYTKEGAALDTLRYTLNSDTSITIQTLATTNGIPQPARLTTFTVHRLVIYGPYALTPGGIFGSTVSLSR
jgi:hypothetical protein